VPITPGETASLTRMTAQLDLRSRALCIFGAGC